METEREIEREWEEWGKRKGDQKKKKNYLLVISLWIVL